VLKKLLVLLVAGFVLYYLLTAPSGAAEVVRGALDAILDAFGQVGVFVSELVS
jgi:hypothetical protein